MADEHDSINMNDLKHRKEKVEHLEEDDEEEGYAYYDAGKLSKPPRGALFTSVPGPAGTSEKIPWKTITVVKRQTLSQLMCSCRRSYSLCLAPSSSEWHCTSTHRQEWRAHTSFSCWD